MKIHHLTGEDIPTSRLVAVPVSFSLLKSPCATPDTCYSTAKKGQLSIQVRPGNALQTVSHDGLIERTSPLHCPKSTSPDVGSPTAFDVCS